MHWEGEHKSHLLGCDLIGGMLKETLVHLLTKCLAGWMCVCFESTDRLILTIWGGSSWSHRIEGAELTCDTLSGDTQVKLCVFIIENYNLKADALARAARLSDETVIMMTMSISLCLSQCLPSIFLLSHSNAALSSELLAFKLIIMDRYITN